MQSSRHMWPTIIGLCVFAVIMAVLMGFFGNHDYPLPDVTGTATPPPMTRVSGPYPYDPADPTEGGRYPDPQNPAGPPVALRPGEPGGSIYPIRPIDFQPDPDDSLRTVATDRLNVLLEKKNNDTGRAFMAEFKRLYPAPEYKFIYFDTLSYRLQMQIPPAKRKMLKDSLNSQMPSFDFLLFDEEALAHNRAASAGGAFASRARSWHFGPLGVDQAWLTTRGDSAVTVAVVDDGFDLNHPMFAGKVVKPLNVPERNAHIYPVYDAREPHSHGTHVAALAVGATDGIPGLSGIAPGCKLMPVQVATSDGSMTTTAILDGLLYAIYSGADVINMSLGPDVPGWFRALPVATQQQLILQDDQRNAQVYERVMQIAAKRGCTLVFSAGNESVLSGYASKARNPLAIIVSSISSNGRRTGFSNYGEYPGWPTNYSTISAPGDEIVSADHHASMVTMSGTSQASPIVAGAVALIKSVNRNLGPADIKEILRSSGTPSQEPIGPILRVDRAVQMARSWTPGQAHPAS